METEFNVVVLHDPAGHPVCGWMGLRWGLHGARVGLAWGSRGASALLPK